MFCTTLSDITELLPLELCIQAKCEQVIFHLDLNATYQNKRIGEWHWVNDGEAKQDRRVQVEEETDLLIEQTSSNQQDAKEMATVKVLLDLQDD